MPQDDGGRMPQDNRGRMPQAISGPSRGRIRDRRMTSLTRGVHVPRPPDGRAPSRLTRLQGWSLVLPQSGGFTHVTAAWLYGWHLPSLPEGTPVFAATYAPHGRPRRTGIRVTRHPAPPPLRVRAGLPVVEPEEALLAAARDLGRLDVTILVDCATHRGDTTRDLLLATAASGRPGARCLRLAVEQSDHRSESPWETVLRVFHTVCGIDVVPQYELRDEAGRFVARGDLWLPGTTVLHEYDGGVHRDRQQHHRDLARERAIGRVGWTRRGYTSDDLLLRPLEVLRDADAAVGRAHQPTRLEAWREQLSESGLTNRGRARLLVRWKVR